MTKNNLVYVEPIKIDFEGVSEAILKYDWSPIVFEKNIRNSKHFTSSELLVLDFDAGMTLNIATQIFAPYQHIIATTRNHQVEKNGVKCDRFRVIMPFESAITDPQQYKHNVSRVVKKYNSDRACADCARFFFKSIKIHSIKLEGYKHLVAIAPQPKDFTTNTDKKASANYADLAKLKRFLETPIAVGQRNRLCFWVIKRLLELKLDDSAMYNIVKNSQAFKGFPESEIMQTIINARKY